jgi:hypothetical protein
MNGRTDGKGFAIIRYWVAALALGVAIGALGSHGARADVGTLEGSWATGCISVGNQYVKHDLYITEQDVYSAISLYTQPGCFDLKIRLEDHLSYKMSGASSLISGAVNVDLVEQRSFMTVMDQATSDQWSAGRFCDIVNWNVGIPVEVTGHQCGDHAIAKMGDLDFDLYLREPSGKLWIGLRTPDFDGSKPEKRPHDVNRALLFQQLGG